MAQVQKKKFRLSTKRTSPFKSAGGVSSIDYWQASCAHQPERAVLLVQACVLQSRDAYWLPTPFYYFPFISPTVRHRVPSHFNWTLQWLNVNRHQLWNDTVVANGINGGGGGAGGVTVTLSPLQAQLLMILFWPCLSEKGSRRQPCTLSVNLHRPTRVNRRLREIW
jgi:hypothetical protein